MLYYGPTGHGAQQVLYMGVDSLARRVGLCQGADRGGGREKQMEWKISVSAHCESVQAAS